MMYLGGKSRLARQLVQVMRERAPETVAVLEPFMGGGAMTLALAKWRPVLSGDAFPGLVDMYRAVQHGLRCPIGGVTDEQYQAFRSAYKAGDRSPSTLLVGFALSFGGKCFGGNARVTSHPKRQYDRFFNHWADKFTKEQNIYLVDRACDYSDWTPYIRPGVTVYCDPPYAGTEGYETGDWDPGRFWAQCHSWRQLGARIFISEFYTPFQEVWAKDRLITVDSNTRKTATDRLFEVLP